MQVARDYACTRLAWSFMTKMERAEDDSSRSIKHNSFIAMLKAICRNLKIDEIDEVMPDRKTQGDFACYIALFLSIEQR